MRELTNQELRKLNVFKRLMNAVSYQMRKTLWGKFNAYMADVDYKKELICESIEMFLTHSIKDIEKEMEDQDEK